MHILKGNNFKPDARNGENKTFLDVSPIHSKLLQQIQTSSDDWAKQIFNSFVGKPEIIENWIKLGNDNILEAILDRLRLSFPILQNQVNSHDY